MTALKNQSEEELAYSKVWIIVPFSHTDVDAETEWSAKILNRTTDKDGELLRRLRGETKAFASPARDFLRTQVHYFTIKKDVEKKLSKRIYYFQGKPWVKEHSKSFCAPLGPGESTHIERNVPFRIASIWGALYPNKLGFLVFEMVWGLPKNQDGAALAHWAIAVNEKLRTEIGCFRTSDDLDDGSNVQPTSCMFLSEVEGGKKPANVELPSPFCDPKTTFKGIIEVCLSDLCQTANREKLKMFRSDRFPAFTLLNTHNTEKDVPCNESVFEVSEAGRLLLAAKAFGPGHEIWCDRLPVQASTTELKQIEREGVAFWHKHGQENSFRHEQFPLRVRYGYLHLMLVNLYQYMMIQDLHKDLSELTLGVDGISSRLDYEDPEAHDNVIRELSNTRLRIASFLLRESFPEPSILTRHTNFYRRYREALGIPGLAAALSEYAREIDQLSEIRRQTESHRNTEKMTAHREKTEKGLFVMTVAAESSAIPYYSNRAFYYIGREVMSIGDEKSIKIFAAAWALGFTALVLGATLYLFRDRIKEWREAFFAKNTKNNKSTPVKNS